jgi:pimeloyl-ACP methyl ester carboxylesterase
LRWQAVVGTNWDIVGFDPRGMWLSEPVANCSFNITFDQNATLQSRFVPRVTDEFYNGYIDFGNALGMQCEKLTGALANAGPHMSTAVTARDMLSIVNAFAETEDGKRASRPGQLLNYYGISYGSFLGQTFASMFPDRAGYMVLDGVINPEAYLANFISDVVNHVDGIIAAFFIYCHEAGPSECLYHTGSTPRDIYNRFNASFIELDAEKASYEGWSNASDIESALRALKIVLLDAADTPISYFGIIPEVLLGLENAISAHSLSAWADQTLETFGEAGPAASANAEWTLGVVCSDQGNRWYNKTLQDLRPLIGQLENQSIVGEVWSKTTLGCLGWPIKAAEIYAGPFGGDTATPILFVSNTYDPATPIEK